MEKQLVVLLMEFHHKFPLKEKDIQIYLDKRRPGQSKYTTQRKEEDKVEILIWCF